METGSVSLTFDRAGNLFNQAYDADGKLAGLLNPQAGQPTNIAGLLANTYNSQDRLTLLQFAADNIDPMTYAAPAAQLDFDLHPSAKTWARLQEVNNANTLGQVVLVAPLLGASAAVGTVVLPLLGGAESTLALSSSSVVADTVFQVGNTALGNQQGWNPVQTVVAAGVPVVVKAASTAVSSLLDGAASQALKGTSNYRQSER
jgi:hypothetical protein